MALGLGFLLAIVLVEVVLMRAVRAFAARAAGVFGVRVLGASRPNFDAASRWARPSIFVACVSAFYTSIVVLFFIANLLRGEPSFDGHVHVIGGAAAEAAGLRDTDRIIAIDGAPVPRFDAVHKMVMAAGDRAVDVEVEREGSRLHLTVSPRDGRIGVGEAPGPRQPMPIGTALWEGIKTPFIILWNVGAMLYELLAGRAEGRLGGAVSMVSQVSKAHDSGFADLLAFSGGVLVYYGFPLLLLITYISLPSRPKRPKSV